MDSIIVKVSNGLGNQMFQYGIARHLSLINDCSIKFDYSQYDDNNEDSLGLELNLNRFNIVGEIATREEVDSLAQEKKRINNRIFRALATRYRIHIGKYFFHKKTYIEDIWNGNLNVLKAKPPVYLNGGWYKEKYINGIRNVLKEELTLKNELRNSYFSGLLKNINESNNSVGIHFRRNYALWPESIWAVLDLEYFYKGIDYLNKEIGNLDLFVFADDINWVKENFKPKQKITIVERSEHLTDAHDWELLKNCKHQIISNSTFSWWAAYLNSNSNKIIVAPRIWYNSPKHQKRYEKGKPVSANWVKI